MKKNFYDVADKKSIEIIKSYNRYYSFKNKSADIIIMSFIFLNIALIPFAIFIPNKLLSFLWILFPISNIIHLVFIKNNIDKSYEKIFLLCQICLNIWIKISNTYIDFKYKKNDKMIKDFFDDLNNQRKIVLPIWQVYYQSGFSFSFMDNLLTYLEEQDYEKFCHEFESVESIIDYCLSNKSNSMQEPHFYYQFLKVEEIKTKLETTLTVKEETIPKRNKI